MVTLKKLENPKLESNIVELKAWQSVHKSITLPTSGHW